MTGKLLSILLTFIIAGCAEAPVHNPVVDNETLHSIVASQDGFSGHVLVADKETVLFNKTYGYSATKTKMTVSDRWRWASVTKQVVAVTILQMVEQGHFSLDTKVIEVLPQTKIPNADKITIRNLLQHTSGLINDADLPDNAFITGFDARAFCARPAKALPGETFEYNNCDFVVLGQILEKTDKTNWFDSLERRIFKPAGMTSLRIGKDNGGETVSGYISEGVAAPAVALPLYEASGELVGQVDDLLKFDRALLSGAFIKPKTRALLWDSDPALGYAALGQWVFPGQLKGCAEPVQLVERRGAISGVQVLNIMTPEKSKSVIVFVNRDNFEWGAVWSQQGFAYDLLSAALCEG